MPKTQLTDRQRELKIALEEFYGASMPDDCDTSLYTAMPRENDVSPLFEDHKNSIVGLSRSGRLDSQTQNPLYGEDDSDETLTPVGHQEIVQLVNQHEDGNDGLSDYHVSGTMRRWVKPTLRA